MAAVASCLLIAGCGEGDAPTGQVVATVDGQEITTADLNAELGGARAQNPQQQKQLQMAALQTIVNRMILAKAAADAGVTDTPAAAIARRKAEQLANIGLLEQQLRGSVPQVSREEAEQFVTDNPATFAQRRIFLVEQIVVPSPPRALLTALEPLDTLAEVQAELAKYNLPTRTTLGVIDALTMDPNATRQIAALAPNAVFILPDNNAIRINRIRESQVEPVTGDAAVNIAREILQNRRINRQVAETVGARLREGQEGVRYNPEFQPPRPPAGAPGAPAANSGAAPAASQPAAQSAAQPAPAAN